jgi:hypothetical protein
MQVIRNLLLIVVFLLFSLLVVWTIFEVTKDILYRSVVQQDVTQEGYPVQVYLRLNGFFKDKSGQETFSFQIDKVDIYPEMLLEPGASFCIKKMYVLTSIGDVLFIGPNGENFHRTVEDFPDFCSDINPKEKIVNKLIGIPNGIYTLFGVQLFPFDTRRQIITIVFDIVTDDGRSLTVTPEIIVNSFIPNWQKTVLISKKKVVIDSEEKSGVQIEVDFQRPFSNKLLTVIFFATLLVFTFGLIKVSDLSGSLQVAVAILLGLWGVQEILIPPSVEQPNLINVGIISLYILLAWSAVTRFIWWPFFNRMRKSKMEMSPTILMSQNSLKVNALEQTTPSSISPEPMSAIMIQPSLSTPTLYQKMILVFLATLTFLVSLLFITRRK